MKILFLTDGIFPFQIGGMQKHSTILSTLLAKEGHQVDVVHCGGEGYSAAKFVDLYEENGAHGVREWFLPFPKTDSLPGHYIRENKHYSRNAFQLLANKIDSYDIIYGQGFTAWKFIEEKRKRHFKAPIFVNFHGYGMFQDPPSLKAKLENQVFRKSVRTVIRGADYIYSFGGKITEIIENQQIGLDRICLQSNGIEHSWLKETFENHSPRSFVFIGRYERGKGIPELNEALGEIKKEGLKFKMHFIGPIPDEVKIDIENVTYHGEIRDKKKLLHVIDHSDCLICPSYYEGMPTVILEAMARGLAVIGTDVGAVSRMIQDNGYLIDSPAPNLIQKAIKEMIILEEDKLTQMKEQSLKMVAEKFLWDVIVKEKIADFEKAIAST